MVLVCCGACEKKANSAYSYCVGAVQKCLPHSDEHSIQQCINKVFVFYIIDKSSLKKK